MTSRVDNDRRDEIAMRTFASVLAAANGLGEVPKDERAKLFHAAAAICYEAADAMIAASKEGGE